MRKPSYIFGGLFVLLIVVYLTARSAGKRKGVEDGSRPQVAPVPDTEHIDPNLNVPAFSEALHRIMSGIFPNYSERRRLLNQLLSLNDSEFVTVYNYFNQNHSNGETLAAWIADEWNVGGDGLQSRLGIRFTSLNLS